MAQLAFKSLYIQAKHPEMNTLYCGDDNDNVKECDDDKEIINESMKSFYDKYELYSNQNDDNCCSSVYKDKIVSHLFNDTQNYEQGNDEVLQEYYDEDYKELTVQECLDKLDKDDIDYINAEEDHKEIELKCKVVIYDEHAFFYWFPDHYYDDGEPITRSTNLGKNKNDAFCGGLDRIMRLRLHLERFQQHNIKIVFVARKSDWYTFKLLCDTGFDAYVDNVFNGNETNVYDKICEVYNITSDDQVYIVHADLYALWILDYQGSDYNIYDEEDDQDQGDILNGVTKNDMDKIECEVLNKNKEYYNINQYIIDNDKVHSGQVMQLFNLLLDEVSNMQKIYGFHHKKILRILDMYVIDHIRLDQTEQLRREDTTQYLSDFVQDLYHLVKKEENYRNSNDPWTMIQLMLYLQVKYRLKCIHNLNFEVKIAKMLTHLKHTEEAKKIYKEVLKEDQENRGALMEYGFYNLTNEHNYDLALAHFEFYEYLYKESSSKSYLKSLNFGMARAEQEKGYYELSLKYYQARARNDLGAIKPSVQFYYDRLLQDLNNEQGLFI